MRFHARVAVNVLGMVERELAIGPDQAAAHADGTGAPRGAPTRRSWRRPSATARSTTARAEVIEVVPRHVRAKLAVAHPGYTDAP